MAMLFLSSRRAAFWSRTVAPVVLALALAGCGGGGGGPSPVGTPTGDAAAGGNRRVGAFADVLRKGDLIQVTYSGIPSPPVAVEERIKEDGTISLQWIGTVPAEGKTPGELQKEIQAQYVPKYFVRLTVTVKTERRVFYVDGEVRRPDRFVYEGEISLLQAIASAQGFTDFAARGRVELIRTTGERLVIDARKAKGNPKLDVPIVPGDTILVPRRSPFGR